MADFVKVGHPMLACGCCPTGRAVTIQVDGCQWAPSLGVLTKGYPGATVTITDGTTTIVAGPSLGTTGHFGQIAATVPVGTWTVTVTGFPTGVSARWAASSISTTMVVTGSTVSGNTINMSPAVGYACSRCCPDPLKTTLAVSVTYYSDLGGVATITDAGTITFPVSGVPTDPSSGDGWGGWIESSGRVGGFAPASGHHIYVNFTLCGINVADYQSETAVDLGDGLGPRFFGDGGDGSAAPEGLGTLSLTCPPTFTWTSKVMPEKVGGLLTNFFKQVTVSE